MLAQSVSSYVYACAWQAAMAACRAYGPGAPVQVASARCRAVMPRAMSMRFQRLRFWSLRRTGAPSGPVREAAREAWNSRREVRACTSGSLGISPDSTRASRSASSQSPGRSQSSPAVAAYPSLKIR